MCSVFFFFLVGFFFFNVWQIFPFFFLLTLKSLEVSIAALKIKLLKIVCGHKAKEVAPAIWGEIQKYVNKNLISFFGVVFMWQQFWERESGGVVQEWMGLSGGKLKMWGLLGFWSWAHQTRGRLLIQAGIQDGLDFQQSAALLTHLRTFLGSFFIAHARSHMQYIYTGLGCAGKRCFLRPPWCVLLC